MDWVREYRRLGLNLVPVAQGQKAPSVKNWQIPQEWDLNGHNVGVLLGNTSHLADVDLDSDVAVEFTKYLDLEPFIGKLPVAVFGRASKKVSHIVVRQTSCRPSKFRDPDSKEVLLEVRGNGQQTVFPPSKHPSGETLEWVTEDAEHMLEGKPLDDDYATELAGIIAAGAIMLQRWEEGARNDMTLALSGWLPRAGWTLEMVQSFILAICRASGDTEEDVRIATIIGTVDKVSAGQETTGLPSLGDIVGDNVSRYLLKIVGGSSSKKNPLTDMQVVKMIEENGNLLWDATRGVWIRWNGVVWENTQKTGILDEIQEVADYFRDVARTSTGAAKESALDRVKALEEYPRIKRVEGVAAMHRALKCYPDDLDPNPYILNCPNGVVDLRTGQLREARKEDMCTRVTGVTYNPDELCPLTLDLVERSSGSPQMVEYVQMGLGISVVGLVTKNVFVLYGPTNAGKTTFLAMLVRKALGTYVAELHNKALKLGEERSEMWIASLGNARLVIASEPPRDLVFDAGFLKSITGGNKIVARALYNMPVEMVPKFTLWVDTNHRPEVPDSDNAIWNRLKPIFFKNSVRIEKGEPGYIEHFEEVVESELPGVLAWIVQGAVKALANWNGGQLPAPADVSESRDDWRDNSDMLSLFIEECIERKEDVRLPLKEAYEAYVAWCKRLNYRMTPLGRNSFISAMEERNFERVKRSNEPRSWKGCQVIVRGDDNPYNEPVRLR